MEVGEKIILEVRKAEWRAFQQPAVSTWNWGKTHEKTYNLLEGDTIFNMEIPL